MNKKDSLLDDLDLDLLKLKYNYFVEKLDEAINLLSKQLNWLETNESILNEMYEIYIKYGVIKDCGAKKGDCECAQSKSTAM